MIHTPQSVSLFDFQLKNASCIFELSAAARALSRLASRNASHFVAASLPRIPILNQYKGRFD
jgi:hypothetical protein